MRVVIATMVVSLLVSGVAAGQHEHPSPYAGQQHSEIPSLSPQELTNLQTAAGMGLARAAELNHYPGPLHVIELADSLNLTPPQRAEILQIQSIMRTRALDLGQEIIAAERELNLRFRHGHVDSAAVRDMTARIATLYGELRYTHLAAHLATEAVLTPDQVTAYDRLRGYAGH